MPINPGHSAFSESPNIRDATPARDEGGRFTPSAPKGNAPPPKTPLKTYPAFNSKGEKIQVTIPED